MLENIKQFATIQKGTVLRGVIQALERLGYDIGLAGIGCPRLRVSTETRADPYRRTHERTDAELQVAFEKNADTWSNALCRRVPQIEIY